MMKKKLLLVTFPVDFGSKTFERRYIDFFANHVDLRVYRFVPDQFVPTQKYSNSLLRLFLTVGKRSLASIELQKQIREANREGRSILFQGVSPALFAYPATKRSCSCIVTDWTRKLYEAIDGKTMSPPWLTFIHRQVLNSQKYVIGLTDAVLDEIARDYDVPHHKLRKGRLPFSVDLDLFIPSSDRNDGIVKILFVGGDFQRKGGDVLLNWFVKQHRPNLRMTIVTGQHPGNFSNVTIRTNIQYGQTEHIELFKGHDIFVLPTKCDAYPSVIGEAACAGLAVLTTKNALGASEIIQNGINGYICNSQEELLDQLSLLVQNKALIESMKQSSRQIMEQKFAMNLVLGDFMSCIFED
ncbi:glycosyltransferase family 4 protein [Leptodesmis sichuanensis]|uniref:glycosyltransferase family 4 protein n=1 Tax=Leptodesmis sichuanensis TaxID=2906798 RepID=UPI001F443E5D|nr:glycosyltransferase family 4 protein [Leptodesmis sichuanensis]UIE37504.1 glycosyltransferase family 4 protein [Leptodesmis sichuanensis A121]